MKRIRLRPTPLVKPRRTNGYEVLSEGKLARRSAEVFPTAYTTLLSIAQGVALGTLIPSAAGAFDRAEAGHDLSIWLATVASGGAIVVVFYMYTWFVLVFRWAPGVWDTVIPLGLGTVEIVLANRIGFHSQWLVWLLLLFVAGGLAFGHSIRRSSTKMFSAEAAYRLVDALLHLLRLLSFIGGALVAVALIGMNIVGEHFLIGDAPAAEMLVSLASGMTLVLLFVMLKRSEIVLDRVYGVFGMRRWPESVVSRGGPLRARR